MGKNSQWEIMNKGLRLLMVMLFSLAFSKTFAQGGDMMTKPQWNNPAYINAQDYIRRNLHYPDSAKIKHIEGAIMVIAHIDTSGQITDVDIEKDLGYGTGAEAMRVVKSMPPFKPATRNGHVVRTMMKFPVNFTLPKTLDQDSIRKTDSIFAMIPDQMAQYPGGDDACNKYIVDHLQLDKSIKYTGTIFISIDILPNGDLNNLKIVEPKIKALDDEILRVMKTMPKWNPARKLGHPIKSTLFVAVKVDIK